MSRISSRYAPHLLGLLVVVAIPAYLHSGGRTYQDDCANPRALLEAFEADGGFPIEQKLDRLNVNIIQWTEGRIAVDGASDVELEFAVTRSFRPSNLYIGFSRLRPGFIEPEEIRVRTVEVDGREVPVRVLLATDHQPARLAVYLTVYDHTPTANPFARQLTTAVRELFGTLPPLTMYFLFGEVPMRHLQDAEDRAVGWLADAWRQYEAACIAPGPTAMLAHP